MIRPRTLLILALLAPWPSPCAAQNEGKPAEIRRPDVLYSEESPFRRPIARDAEVDPESPRMLRSLVRAHREQGFVLAVREWTVPVYFAGETTPRHDVALTADWAPALRIADVPIPPWAEPAPDDDGAMVVIDPGTGCEYDFWQARVRNGRWTASWANSIRLSGDGVYPRGLSARGSGFALLAGVIWPQELRRGRIDHALVFTYSYPRSGGPVPPATESDGETDGPEAIPEGARLQLDPLLDLESLDLEPHERIIARCLQEYGMFLGDSGGGIEIEAIHPLSARGDPYAGLLPESASVDLAGIPVERFRVLKLPPQMGEVDPELVPSGCGRMERRD